MFNTWLECVVFSADKTEKGLVCRLPPESESLYLVGLCMSQLTACANAMIENSCVLHKQRSARIVKNKDPYYAVHKSTGMY